MRSVVFALPQKSIMSYLPRLAYWVLGSLLLLHFSASLPAQEGFVSVYVEGDAILIGEEERRVDIGDTLERDAILSLGESAYLEIAGAGRTVRLLGPGEYRLSELPAHQEKGGFSAGVTGRAKHLLRDGTRGDVAIAGVRGDLATNDGAGLAPGLAPGSGLGDGPAEELREAARDALEAGQVENAVEI